MREIDDGDDEQNLLKWVFFKNFPVPLFKDFSNSNIDPFMLHSFWKGENVA